MIKTKTDTEPRAQDLEDIESGEVKPNCFNCRKKQIRFVKTIEMIGQFGQIVKAKTKNYIGVCQNKECFRYCDEKQMPSWMRD